jgi:hypothetical protein
VLASSESIEQEKIDINIRRTQAAGGVVPNLFAATWDYPWNTCTCIKAIGWPGPALQPPTLPGRHAGQPPLRPTTGARGRERNCIGDDPANSCYDSVLNNLVARRDANDLWLQSISRPKAGVLCRASPSTKRARNKAKSSSHRACTCGGNASDTQPHNAEVLMCMACEGLWCLIQRGTPGSKYQAPRRSPRRNAPSGGDALRNARGVGDMRLGRPVAPYTDTRAP